MTVSVFTELDQLRTELKNKDKEILKLKQELKTTTEKMKHFDSKQNNLKNRLQRARKADLWISVKEHLPTSEKPCNMRILVIKGEFVEEAIFNTLTGNFLDIRFREINDLVTHWQPLPKKTNKI